MNEINGRLEVMVVLKQRIFPGNPFTHNDNPSIQFNFFTEAVLLPKSSLFGLLHHSRQTV